MPNSAHPRLTDSLFNWLFGMIGSFLLVLSLPRLMSLFGRRMLPRMVSEMIAIALTGLLAEKLLAWIARDNDRQS
ncbi:MAG: hypothetical protein SH809_13865 [Rhodothermales bacterium]|nr:hypothetical protein [Rhodothermales bacterium]